MTILTLPLDTYSDNQAGAVADTTLGGLNIHTTGAGNYTIACDLNVSIVDAV